MGLEKYESRQESVERPAAEIYERLSDFTNFTPILEGKAEDWQATPDSCSFKASGMNVTLNIVDREPNSLIKIKGDDGSPFDFTLWIQMKQVEENDTRLRLVLHAELNMMMRMMIGGKIKPALDGLVKRIADGLNGKAASEDEVETDGQEPDQEQTVEGEQSADPEKE